MLLAPDTFRRLSVALSVALLAAVTLFVVGCPSQDSKPTPKAMAVDPSLTRPNSNLSSPTTAGTTAPASGSEYGSSGPQGYAAPKAQPIPFYAPTSARSPSSTAPAATGQYTSEQKAYFASLTKSVSPPLPPTAPDSPTVAVATEQKYTKAPNRDVTKADAITKGPPPPPKKATATTSASASPSR